MRLCISVNGVRGEMELVSLPGECREGFPADIAFLVGVSGMRRGQGWQGVASRLRNGMCRGRAARRTRLAESPQSFSPSEEQWRRLLIRGGSGDMENFCIFGSVLLRN